MDDPLMERAMEAEVLLDKVKTSIFDQITKNNVCTLKKYISQDIRSLLKDKIPILKGAYDDNIFPDRQEHIGLLIKLSTMLNEENYGHFKNQKITPPSQVQGPTQAVREDNKLTDAQINIFVGANGEPLTINPIVLKIKRTSRPHKQLFSNMLNIHITQVITALKSTVNIFVRNIKTLQLHQVFEAIVQLNGDIEKIKFLTHRKLTTSPIKPKNMQHLSAKSYRRETNSIVDTVFRPPLEKLKSSGERWVRGEFNEALLELKDGLQLLSLTTANSISRMS